MGSAGEITEEEGSASPCNTVGLSPRAGATPPARDGAGLSSAGGSPAVPPVAGEEDASSEVGVLSLINKPAQSSHLLRPQTRNTARTGAKRRDISSDSVPSVEARSLDYDKVKQKEEERRCKYIPKSGTSSAHTFLNPSRNPRNLGDVRNIREGEREETFG